MFEIVARKQRDGPLRRQTTLDQGLPDRTRTFKHLRVTDALPLPIGAAARHEPAVRMRARTAHEPVGNTLGKRAERFAGAQIPAVAAPFDQRRGRADRDGAKAGASMRLGRLRIQSLSPVKTGAGVALP
jgi:hypothetical protein